MAERGAPLSRQSAPRVRRKRRQALQQTRCCACLVLLVALIVTAVLGLGRLGHWRAEGRERREAARAFRFPLELEIPERSYWRYQLVPIVLRLNDAEGKPRVSPEPPAIMVQYQGETVVTVGNLQKLYPRYRREKQDYLCQWPVPWGAKPGEYTVTARMKLTDPEAWQWAKPNGKPAAGAEPEAAEPEGLTWCVAQASFWVEQRQPATWPAGSCIATWEMDFPEGQVPLPRGGKSDWRGMMEWCKFLGADTLVFRGAVTNTNRGALSAEQPWVAHNLTAIPTLGAEAHRQGLKFGVYAVAYETLPYESNRGKPAYAYAQDISRSTGQVRPHHFVSLLDAQRRADLTEFCRQMQADPNVDLVGMDYIRGDTGGYELTEAFTKEMPVALPSDWGRKGETERWQYMATKVERDFQTVAGAAFYDQWNWWKAHTVSQNVASILQNSGLQKPSFIFMLSWMHGVQHGQDANMFTDAGVTVLLPMLYQMPSQGHFEYTMRQWADYMRPGQANLMPGNQLDDPLHQRTRIPAAPERFYQRLMEAQKRMIYQGRPLGAFFHDISRAALMGRRGPYPGTEWCLAGAAAFSQYRQALGVYPLQFTLTGPSKVFLGVPFEVRVTVKNASQQTLKNVRLSLETTPGVKAGQRGRRALPPLEAGVKTEVPMEAVVTTPLGERENRYMVCVRADWPQKDYGKGFSADMPATFVLMKYVQGRALGGGTQP